MGWTILIGLAAGDVFYLLLLGLLWPAGWHRPDAASVRQALRLLPDFDRAAAWPDRRHLVARRGPGRLVVSSQPMLMTTSAREMVAVVTILGSSPVRSMPTSRMAWTAAGLI
jgi:hypothetical protein